jgi:hypothetical protein
MNRARAVALAVILAMASGPSLWAGTRKASRADAPQRLGEALASGTADAETIASIVRWVLEEEPEKVAPALASALHAAIDESPGGRDERWNATAHSAVDLAREACPAVAEALAEVLRRPSPPPPR